MAYGDVTAAMNALPRAGETLSGAWTRQDLLYESDTEALSVNPLCISKKESESSVRVSIFWGEGRKRSSHELPRCRGHAFLL